MVSRVKVVGGADRDYRRDGSVVDPRADVHPDAVIGPDCQIGPFAVVGAGVSLGEGCALHGHAVVLGPTILGPGNEIHPFACVGGSPQDLRHRGEPTRLVVGRDNVFREHVTVSRGTAHGGGETTIGDANLLMAYCHVAHDCRIGSHVVMANCATLAGHVQVEDHVVFGGLVAVGAFLRVGESAMLAAGSMIEREVPPFCTVAGDRARLRAVNRVGLDRRSVGPDARAQIKQIFRALKARSESLEQIIAQCRETFDLTDEASRMLIFLERVERGLTR
ncbi:MAG: acyl-ACP--UDP-N-acetylglucosamine O-acyltransferase [Deltaproteobacteria bacterium]|nr:acyl-ACP--UDP-N-acetylglucosamine O-acyltransferase [Deltaproteobacteria bacterium]